MANLYADENFDYPVVVELQRLGHDVLTAQRAGQAQQGIPDPAVLAFASAQGRAVLTFNRRHFIRLHLHSSVHSGIITCTKDDDSIALAGRIHLRILSLVTLDGQLVRITRPSSSSP
jgi:hypothetical protein